MIGFIATALVVLLLPGPGVMYVVARSASQGFRAGLASAVGLSAGALVHVLAAAAGLSAILLASATAFTVVKLMGAAYLCYLGLQMLLSGRPSADIATTARLPLRRLVYDGVIVSVFNPKIAVFFLAFLPQFVAPGGGSIAQQILILGLVYSGLALLTDSAYAFLASNVRQWLGGRMLRGRVPRYLGGSIYLGLGVTAALTGRQD